jgi:lipopolysaccharide/colanic/teichoic acid biosynthesis glycosyltransferase
LVLDYCTTYVDRQFNELAQFGMKFAQLLSEYQKYSRNWLAKQHVLDDLEIEKFVDDQVPVLKNNSMNTPTYPESNSDGATIGGAAEARRSLPNRVSGDTVLLRSVSAGHSGVKTAQRVLDIVFCGLLLVAIWPIFGVIALMIKLDSAGPVLFKQFRVGQDGVEFPFYKFRSMVSDAEARRHQLEMQNERSGPVFKMRNDPRVTRAGRFLRKFSLDELPQLINVLKGEMSLVGPRPALPTETSKYTPRQKQRLICLPGVTGLWQVSGRASLSFERSIELDLYYIEHQSVALYFRILLMTIPAVFRAEGAY